MLQYHCLRSVAQLVERFVRDEEARGSSPRTPTWGPRSSTDRAEVS